MEDFVMPDQESGFNVELSKAEESTDGAWDAEGKLVRSFKFPSRSTGLFFEKFLRLDNTERCVLHKTFDR